MLLNLRDVLASDKLATDFDYAVDLSGEELYGERPFREPVQAKGRLADKAGVFRLTARVEAPVETRCARCGAPVRLVKELDLALTIVRSAGEDAAEDVYEVNGDSFELDEIIREQLILNMDMTVLCREDCKGLCPKCGRNLNEGDCGCDRTEIDPRLAKLKQLLKE